MNILKINQKFKELDCNNKETAVYLSLLKHGAMSVQETAKKVQLNRVTTHDTIERLLEKGLLAETRAGKKRLLVAEDPKILYSLLEEKKQQVGMLEKSISQVVENLEALQSKDRSRPDIRFFEGVRGFKLMLEETLSAKGEVLVFSNVDRLAEIIGTDYLEKYFKRRARLGINTRLIFPPCDFASHVAKKSQEYRIQIKTLPPELQWRSAIFSWNNALSIKSFSDNKLTCTIIENSDIAHFFRNIIFELIWNMANKLPEQIN